MDRSKEINSLERRATKLAWQQSMPPLSMPVYFEDEEPPCLLYTSDAADE